MVYLIDFGTCYKIGITTDLKRRLKEFRNSREKVRCLNVIVNSNILNPTELDLQIETILHDKCKKYKITRELFQKVPEIELIFSEFKKEIGDNVDYTESIINIINNLDTKASTRQKKEVFQYSLDGTYINRYNSRAEAEEINNIYSGKICDAISGRNLTAGGYIWSDSELTKEEIKEKVDRINNSKISKLQGNSKLNQYTKDNTFIRCWNTMSEASRELGIAVSSISLCCKGTYKTAGGFIWRIE